MPDDQNSWQDAALNANDVIGPSRPADADQAAASAGDEFDELESGIASIFAALHAANEDGTATEGADEADDDGLADAHTYALLSELDRLWQRPSP